MQKTNKFAQLYIEHWMKLGGQDIQWCQSVKYLGDYLMAGKKLCFDISPVNRALQCV